MMGREAMEAPGAVGQPLFATTHRSVVLAAADEETREAAAALERRFAQPMAAPTQADQEMRHVFAAISR